MPSALTCKELVELVTAYVEGTLAPAERERFEAHLAGCSGCRHYVEQMITTIRLTGRLDDQGLAAETRAALLKLFREWKQQGG